MGAVAVLVALVVAAITAGVYYYPHRVPNAIDSVAVLPLAITSNSDMDYLADGITEGVINHLSRLPRLRVAYADRSSRLEYIKQEHFFEPFRFDPRYVDLLRRVGAATVAHRRSSKSPTHSFSPRLICKRLPAQSFRHFHYIFCPPAVILVYHAPSSPNVTDRGRTPDLDPASTTKL